MTLSSATLRGEENLDKPFTNQTIAIQKKLEALGPAEEGDNQQLKDSYQQTLTYLQEQNEFQARAAELNTLITDYGPLSEQLLQKTKTYQSSSLPTLTELPVSEALQKIALNSAKLLDLKNQQSNFNNELTLSSGRQVTIPEQINNLKSTQESLIGKVSNTTVVDTELSKANRMLDNAHLQAVNEQMKMLELELLGSGNRQGLIKLQTRLLDNEIADLTRITQNLQDYVAEQRRQETEKAVAASNQLTDVDLSSHPLIKQQAQENDRLSSQLTSVNAEIEQSRLQKSTAEQQNQQASNKLQRIKKQLQWLKDSAIFGQTLRAELASLPPLPDIDQLLQRQGEAQFENYDLEQESELLQQFDQYISLLTESAEPPLGYQDSEALIALIRARSGLVSRLLESNRSLLGSLAQYEVAAQQLHSQIQQFQELVAQHLLWVPNTGAANAKRLPLLQQNLIWLFSLERWQQVVPVFYQTPKKSSALLFFSVVVLALWFLGRKRLASLQRTFSPHVGKVAQDRFSNSLHLLIAGLFYALPLPLLFFATGRLLQNHGDHAFVQGVGQGLIWHSYMLLFWVCCRNWGGPQGLLAAHLHWQARGVQQWLRQLRRLVFFSFPLLIIIAITEAIDSEAMRTTLGRGAFVCWCLGLSLFFLRTLREKLLPDADNTAILHRQRPYLLIWGLLVLIPLSLAGISLFGYFYTGLKLISMLLYSLVIASALILTYGIALRGLLIQERRIAFEQAKTRRAEMLAQRAKEEERCSETPMDLLDENYIDLKTISDQTRGLVKILLWIAFGVLMWTLWSPLFSALNILDTIVVWETTLNLNGTQQLQPITLKAFSLSLSILLLMWIGIRNLPGVMQLLVLQHLSLSPGTGYAVTTLLNYLLILVGIVISFNILGFDWSKVQWLVAALSVGLGFGLQEIFANFISGLIILFEKPIRIGDTITINGLTGSVSKIQIRATTIVDWDRKEIIVPNKSFITEQLVNWSLSDPITRVKILVGVAYGSDTELVERLLLEAAGANTMVLDSPKPEAFFISFGDSTLNYELRVYVSEMSSRNPVIHGLHNLIDRKFRANKVEIAFPQLDLHIKRS
ncbi:MAG: mechanosensitive ion channel domain-containing protein [Motiliproteus sp.]